jgi:uncharacterized protein YjbI with pentapeptide repeats
MANRSHLSILKRGARAWNRWRIKYPYITPELRWANLRNASLCGADLRGADLRGADLAGANVSEAEVSNAALKGADLTGANLVQTNLTGANLSGANLNCANLSGAILENADLTGANLFRAILDEANLVGADFSETEVGYTKFSNVDLSAARGLETLKHFAPSSIGIDTICISEKKIPADFLRCAGVPEKLIDYVQCMEDKALRFHSCFISYSSKDQAFAEKLRASLEDNGVKCWLAPETLSCGEKIYAELDQGKKGDYKVLPVISENSIASQWIGAKLERARQCEIRENRRCLFPVRLVNLREKINGAPEIPGELQEYGIQDFSDWENNDSYRKAFERLLAEMRECDRRESPATSDSSACSRQS